MFDTAKNGLTGSFETAFALAVSVPSPTRTAEVIEDRLFGYKRFMSIILRAKGYSDLHPVEKDYSTYSEVNGEGTHHQFAPLVIDCHLLYHLFFR